MNTEVHPLLQQQENIPEIYTKEELKRRTLWAKRSSIQPKESYWLQGVSIKENILNLCYDVYYNGNYALSFNM